MKYTYFKILLIGIIGIITSCNITQKIIVKGQPGTKIYDSEEKYIATIDHTGETSISLDRTEKYHFYLQAQSPQSEFLVPFALDYVNRKRPDGGPLFAFSFLLPPAVGQLWGFPVFLRLISYGDKDFDYLDNQQTNEDIIK